MQLFSLRIACNGPKAVMDLLKYRVCTFFVCLTSRGFDHGLRRWVESRHSSGVRGCESIWKLFVRRVSTRGNDVFARGSGLVHGVEKVEVLKLDYYCILLGTKKSMSTESPFSANVKIIM